MTHEFDVAIAGGGPVGLAASLFLRRAGLRVVVLEAAPDRGHLQRGFLGARSVNVASGNVLAALGVLDRIREGALFWLDPRTASAKVAGPSSGAPSPYEGFVGHFAGIGLQRRFLDPTGLGDLGSGGGAVGLGELVDALEDAAQEGGVEVRAGHVVIGFTEEGDGVAVAIEGHAPLRARWLVAADGGRSRLRKAAGVAFPGTDAEFVGRIAFVEFAGEPPAIGDWVEAAHGSYLHAPFGRLHVVEYGGPAVDRDAPVTAAEVSASFERVTGAPLAIARVSMGQRYSDAARQVSAYRSGRVFFAGDAAHIHSPAGGQGLNQGLGDAAVLAEILAPVARGEAAEETLDDYDRRRRPVGAAILDWTRAQSALGRVDPGTRALRRVVADLLASAPSTTYVLRRLNGEGPAAPAK